MKQSKMMCTVGMLVPFLFVSFAFAAELKIGYVDSQAILAKLKETKDVQDKLNELYKTWEQEAKNMEQEIQKKQEDFEAKSLMLTDKAKAERAQEIQAMALQLRQFEQEKFGAQGEYFKEQNRLMQPIIEKIQNAINKVGEDDGYDYIFDTVNANIVYVSKSQTNLTERIIAELEKSGSATISSSEKSN